MIREGDMDGDGFLNERGKMFRVDFYWNSFFKCNFFY